MLDLGPHAVRAVVALHLLILAQNLWLRVSPQAVF
jgi:hypothetical protein